jgi:hypothetical protein
MIKHPLERAYSLLAQSLEKNDKEKIQIASQIEAQNTCVGDDSILGFNTLSPSNPRVEISLQTRTRQLNEWDAAVAEAVDAIQILRV